MRVIRKDLFAISLPDQLNSKWGQRDNVGMTVLRPCAGEDWGRQRISANMAKRKLGAHSLIFDDDEVIQLLSAAVQREGTQDAFAKRQWH
jgi:hypothetical protein